jgi:hypothetical protein
MSAPMQVVAHLFDLAAHSVSDGSAKMCWTDQGVVLMTVIMNRWCDRSTVCLLKGVRRGAPKLDHLQ